MQSDPQAHPEIPVPDHVPDELIERYGAVARRTVRRSRSSRRALIRPLRPVAASLRDPDLWLFVLAVFTWSIVGAGAIGALVYAVLLLPGALEILVVPLVALFGASLAVALTWAKRRAPDVETSTF